MVSGEQFLAAQGRLVLVAQPIDDGRALFVEGSFKRRDLCLHLPHFGVHRGVGDDKLGLLAA